MSFKGKELGQQVPHLLSLIRRRASGDKQKVYPGVHIQDLSMPVPTSPGEIPYGPVKDPCVT